jgi:hypothetical protein
VSVLVPTVADRLVVAGVGIFSAVCAVQMMRLNDVPGGRLWPVLFVVTAVACVWLQLDFHNEHAFAGSGAAAVTACLARAAGLILAWGDGRLAEPRQRIILVVLSWMLLAFLIGYAWFRGLRPVVEDRRGAHRR